MRAETTLRRPSSVASWTENSAGAWGFDLGAALALEIVALEKSGFGIRGIGCEGQLRRVAC